MAGNCEQQPAVPCPHTNKFSIGDPICTEEEGVSPILRLYDSVTKSSVPQQENRFYHGPPPIIPKFRDRNEDQLRKTFAAKYRPEIIPDQVNTSRSTVTQQDKSNENQQQNKRKRETPVVTVQAKSQKKSKDKVPSSDEKRQKGNTKMQSSSSFDALSSFAKNGPIPLSAIVGANAPSNHGNTSSHITSPPRRAETEVKVQKGENGNKHGIIQPKLTISKVPKQPEEVTIMSEDGSRKNVIKKNVLSIYSNESEIAKIRSGMLKILGLPKNAPISSFVFK